jgi:hypothetical protein
VKKNEESFEIFEKYFIFWNGVLKINQLFGRYVLKPPLYYGNNLTSFNDTQSLPTSLLEDIDVKIGHKNKTLQKTRGIISIHHLESISSLNTYLPSKQFQQFRNGKCLNCCCKSQKIHFSFKLIKHVAQFFYLARLHTQACHKGYNHYAKGRNHYTNLKTLGDKDAQF